jgi:hypothetical protein
LEIKVGQEEIKADIKALLKEHGSANVKPWISIISNG